MAKLSDQVSGTETLWGSWTSAGLLSLRSCRLILIKLLNPSSALLLTFPWLSVSTWSDWTVGLLREGFISGWFGYSDLRCQNSSVASIEWSKRWTAQRFSHTKTASAPKFNSDHAVIKHRYSLIGSNTYAVFVHVSGLSLWGRTSVCRKSLRQVWIFTPFKLIAE